MKTWAQYLLTTVAAFGAAVAAYSPVQAETCTLEIKRLESPRVFSPLDSIYRATYPQMFNAQVGPAGKNRINFGGETETAAKFKQIVKKEPKYESDHPFRGVAKFGSQEYAFALDESVPESEKKAKSEAEEAKPDAKDAKSQPAKSLAGALLEALSVSDQDNAPKEIKAVGFNRLYFDINHNGDLTDDKVIEAEPQPARGLPVNYRQFEFPRVDLTIDVDGTPVDYAFFLRGYVNASRDFSYAGVQINAAAYREGDITLDGKSRHVVLIDYNSNGRFDDEIKIANNVIRSGGALYPEQGDRLLIDPNAGGPGNSSLYDVTSNSYQHYVSKMVDIDGKYYNLKITPAGDKLTLDPASAPLGKITNPNARFTAVIYGDNGFLKINGEKDAPIAVPAGEWKLLSYTIDLTDIPEPGNAEKKDQEKDKSGISALGLTLETLLSSATIAPPGRRSSHVTADATAKYKPVKVSEGETVEFPFGPPYKPTVTLDYIQGGNENKQASLGMTLFGSVGEVVSDMMVNGARPSKPEFTIKDPKGDVVQSGSFEYG